MRNLLGVLAGVALMIGAMGVAQASDTCFGDWGTAYYDEVIGDRTVNYMHDYAPALDCSAVNYAGCSDYGHGHMACGGCKSDHKACGNCDNVHKGCADCGAGHGGHHAQPVKAGCSSCGGGSHDHGYNRGGCGAGSGNDIIGYGSEDWDWYTI